MLCSMVKSYWYWLVIAAMSPDVSGSRVAQPQCRVKSLLKHPQSMPQGFDTAVSCTEGSSNVEGRTQDADDAQVQAVQWHLYQQS